MSGFNFDPYFNTCFREESPDKSLVEVVAEADDTQD